MIRIAKNFLSGNSKKQLVDIATQTKEESFDLKVRLYPNVTILTTSKDSICSGAYDENKKYIMASSSMVPSYFMPECPQCSNYDDREVVYLGYLNSTFGHVLMDTPQWAWFLDSDFFSNHSNVKCVYTSDYELSDKKWARDLLALYGLDLLQCERIKETAIIKKVWIPDAAKKRAREGLNEVFVFDSLYKVSFQKLLKQIPNTKKYDKIYLSRTKFANHREIGEWRIEEIFKNAGYKIIYPEQLSILEQFTIIRNCSHFATTEGSISHLSVLCRPDTEVVILTKIDYINAYQMLCNHISESLVIYIPAHHSHLSFAPHPMMGPFYLYVTSELKQYVTGARSVKPFWLNPDYWWYVLHNISPCANKYILNRKFVHKLCNL